MTFFLCGLFHPREAIPVYVKNVSSVLLEIDLSKVELEIMINFIFSKTLRYRLIVYGM
jgi:hypothetical protein